MMIQTQEALSPQLVMKRDSLLDLPSILLPEGYGIRSFIPGDETAWETIIHETFHLGLEFQKSMGEEEYFAPERVLFICYGGQPVATASAWFFPEWGNETGYLHMVGVVPAHNGKGLGYTVSLAALARMAEEGRRDVLLQTDDFRVAAIKTYLKLGFRPVITHENQIQRWKGILSSLGRTDLISGLEFKEK